MLKTAHLLSYLAAK